MKVYLDTITPESAKAILVKYENNLGELVELLNCFMNRTLEFQSQVFLSKESADNLINAIQEQYINGEQSNYSIKKNILKILSNSSAFKPEHHDYRYLYFELRIQDNSVHPNIINDEHLISIFEKKIQYSEPIILFCLEPDKYRPKKHISILKESASIECKSILNEVDYTTNIDELILWLDTSRQERIFKANPKHGMAGVNAKRGESQLMCKDSGEANLFLQKAIGSCEGKDLYNYDRDRGLYILFKDENFFVWNKGNLGKQFHGYHVRKEDINNQIPLDIQKKLKDLPGK